MTTTFDHIAAHCGAQATAAHDAMWRAAETLTATEGAWQDPENAFGTLHHNPGDAYIPFADGGWIVSAGIDLYALHGTGFGGPLMSRRVGNMIADCQRAYMDETGATEIDPDDEAYWEYEHAYCADLYVDLILTASFRAADNPWGDGRAAWVFEAKMPPGFECPGYRVHMIVPATRLTPKRIERIIGALAARLAAL